MIKRLSVVALLIGSAGALLPAAAQAQERYRDDREAGRYESGDRYCDHEWREHERREWRERERREHELREREQRERFYSNEYSRRGYYDARGIWCPY